MIRPSWDTTWMRIAFAIAGRSTCPRGQVGAVLVDSENHLVGIGYNGAPHGQPHCSTHGCIVDESTGSCVRSIHAEINAILHASGPGITLYCTHAPCYRCAQAIIQVGVQRVVYARPYRDGDERLDALDLLRDAHLDVVPYREEVPEFPV